MAIQSINAIKNWFLTGKKPTQAQFSDVFDSYRHKNESVDISSVSGLNALLNNAISAAQFNSHVNDLSAHGLEDYVKLNGERSMESTLLFADDTGIDAKTADGFLKIGTDLAGFIGYGRPGVNHGFIGSSFIFAAELESALFVVSSESLQSWKQMIFDDNLGIDSFSNGFALNIGVYQASTLNIGREGAKLGFFGVEAREQVVPGGTPGVIVPGSGTPLTDTCTIDGFTFQQVVRGMIELGFFKNS